MNNQIIRYGETVDLAVYGVIATIMALFQALFAGVGQAIQPLVSSNYGAKETGRIKTLWRMSIITILLLGALFTLIGELFPIHLTKLFMDATPEVLAACTHIFRLHFPLFVFLGVTVISAYYMQSVMQERMAMLVGLMHSVVASGAAILLLPLLLKIDGVWLALPFAELLTALVSFLYIKRCVNPRL